MTEEQSATPGPEDNEPQAPNFDKHIPQLIDQFIHIRENLGPGALCISFEAQTGQCQTYYVKLDDGPPPLKELYDKVDRDCISGEESPVILIFHDSDRTFMEGQPYTFRLRKKEEEDGDYEETKNSADDKNSQERAALPP